MIDKYKIAHPTPPLKIRPWSGPPHAGLPLEKCPRKAVLADDNRIPTGHGEIVRKQES